MVPFVSRMLPMMYSITAEFTVARTVNDFNHEKTKNLIRYYAAYMQIIGYIQIKLKPKCSIFLVSKVQKEHKDNTKLIFFLKYIAFRTRFEGLLAKIIF